MNNRQLLSYHTELEGSKTSVYYFLNQNKIKEFYRENGVRIQGLFDKIQKLHELYFEMDGKNVKHIEVEKDGNKVQEPILQEGKTLDEYKAEYKTLMETEIFLIH